MAAECKNTNGNFLIYRDWFFSHIVSRFKDASPETLKLIIVSVWHPAEQDEAYLTKYCTANNYVIVEVDTQITEPDEVQEATDIIQEKLKLIKLPERLLTPQENEALNRHNSDSVDNAFLPDTVPLEDAEASQPEVSNLLKLGVNVTMLSTYVQSHYQYMRFQSYCKGNSTWVKSNGGNDDNDGYEYGVNDYGYGYGFHAEACLTPAADRPVVAVHSLFLTGVVFFMVIGCVSFVPVTACGFRNCLRAMISQFWLRVR